MKPKYFGYGVYGYQLLGFKVYWWDVLYAKKKDKWWAVDFLNFRLFKHSRTVKYE